MSTTFGILKKDKHITDWLLEPTEDVFIPVCHRWGIGKKLAKERGVDVQVDILNSIWFTLDSCTRLYPLDNTHQGIYTKSDAIPFIISNNIKNR